MPIFRIFELPCFYNLERRFFVLEYRKGHFTGLYSLKKNWEKWPFFDQNHGLTPLVNVNFLTFSTFCFYSLVRRFFVLEYRKRHFTGLNCAVKKPGKMAIFGPKIWDNPFGNMSIFQSFELLPLIV